MHERIKEVRKSANLTQQEFADRIGTPRSNIGGYETGARCPSDAVIRVICEKFHVSEAWLRSGVGDMKADLSLRKELSLMFADVLASVPDKRSAVIAALLSQPPETWELIADLAEDIVVRLAKNKKEG